MFQVIRTSLSPLLNAARVAVSVAMTKLLDLLLPAPQPMLRPIPVRRDEQRGNRIHARRR